MRYGRALALALLGGTILGGVARAQEAALTTAPPVHETVDLHGVDVTTGNLLFNLPLVAVGAGASALDYHRTMIGAGWIESYVGVIRVSGSTYTVSIGAASETFSTSGGGFVSNQGSGSTLTANAGVYTYTTSGGTVATFSPPSAAMAGPYSGNVARISSVKSLDGAVLTFYYEVVNGCGDPAGSYANRANTSSTSATKTAGPTTNALPQCDSNSTYERLQSYQNNLGYTINLGYVSGNPAGSNYPPQIYFPISVTTYNYFNQAGPAAFPSAQFPTPNYAPSRTVTDGLGRTTAFSYDSAGRILTYTPPGQSGPKFTVTYDSYGRVATFNDNYYTANYSYGGGATNFTTTVSGPTGNVVYVSDTTKGVLTSLTDQLSRTTTYASDGAGRLTQVTKAEGDAVQYYYDARGNVTQTTATPKPGSGPAPITAYAGYDGTCNNLATCNKPNYTIDPLGRQTDYTYDPTFGAPTTVTLPAPTSGAVRPQTRFTYATLGAPGGGSVYRLTATSACATQSSCAGGPDEVKTTLGYDVNLQANVSTSGAGDGSVSATTSTVYDGVGNPYTVDGPLPGSADTARFRYDAARQMVGVVGPDPDGAGPRQNRAVRLTYEGRGLVSSQEQGVVASQSDADWQNFSNLLQSTATYDQRGLKLTDATLSNGVIQTLVQTSYNTRGLTQCSTARDPAQAGSLPASACTVTGSGAPGADRIFQQGYDAVGNVTLNIEGVGTGVQSTVASYSYGADNEQLTATDANGYKTTFNYDGFNRLGSINFPDPNNGANSSTAAAQTQSYAYNAVSKVVQKTIRGGLQINYSYDNLNRLTYEQHPTSNGYANIAYGYDNLNRLTATTSVPYGQAQVSHGWNYDALGRKTAELGPLGNSTSTYDAAGRRTRLTWPDGFFVTYDYDTAGAMTAIREYGAGSGSGVLDQFAYDNLGRRSSIVRGNGVVTSYGYDGASRLSSITHDLAGTAQDQTETFSYDVSSRVTSRIGSNDAYAWTAAYNVDRPYSSNGLNEQTVSGSNTITWSGKGTLTGDGANTYLYNSANQIFQTGNGTNETYDGLGRLYAVGSNGATRFLYDGQNAIAEYNTSGQVLRRYVDGPGVDEPLVWYEGSSTSARYGLTADRQGSVTAITADSGGAAAINTYDEYGIPGSNNAGRFQYTGQMYLPEFGVYNYKARNYSPTLGRFMQPDTIGYSSGLHFYNYVHSDPINRTDPTGMVDDAGVGGFANCGEDPTCSIVISGGYGSGFSPGGGGGGPGLFDSVANFVAGLFGRANVSNGGSIVRYGGVVTYAADGSAVFQLTRSHVAVINVFYQDVGGLGHVGLAVDQVQTYGKYASGSVLSSPGTVRLDKLSEPHYTYSVRITNEQAAALENYINRGRAPGGAGSYNLVSANCSVFCSSALDIIGIHVPAWDTVPIDIPAYLPPGSEVRR